LNQSRTVGWIFWSIIHIYFLIGFRNRLMVFINWVWSYLTFGKGARLIPDDKLVVIRAWLIII